MKRNLNLSRGLVFSQRVLIGLVEKGFTREEAYDIVQRSAMECWDRDRTFKEILGEDPGIRSSFSEKEFEDLFDETYYLRFIDTIFDRFPKSGGRSS